MSFISKLLKSILIIIVIGVIVSVTFFILNSQKPADEKIKGVWKYDYNENKSLYFKSDDSGMYVGNIGDKIEVFPLKKGANPNGFHFILERNDSNYEFYVEKIDNNHLTITPEGKDNRSLQEQIFGTKNISNKAKKEETIELKKVNKSN